MTVTLTQLKAALKIDYTTDDLELLRIRDAVIDFITDYTGVSLEPRVNTLYLPYFLLTRLDEMPLISIDSVKYYNPSNVLTTMPSTDYFLIKSKPPSVYLNFSEYPSTGENTEVIVTYTTGYAATPRHFDQAVIALTGHLYNNPEATAPITLSTVPLSAQMILDNMRSKGVLE